ncbi:hypothetical protein H6G06_20615 [Anabaena sphaerica FACHB-251]|uniref:Uncharacterized protein n=1 Tax=Anabaena sphaerica FACHB-251 TaxID=2692883 RepID=A0A926WKS0_9NOST|nr:hypothetical protein [Anabaena sphaerica FACHB-251]
MLVYNLAQRKLRQELAKFDDGIRNQVKKITNKLLFDRIKNGVWLIAVHRDAESRNY